MSEMSVWWGKKKKKKKLKFYSLTGGCHTRLTHVAIDRTLTTILFSFPNETSSVLRWSYWKKNTSIGWMLVSCHISIQGIKFELHAEALPFCYPKPHNYVLFYCNSKNITFRTVNVLAFHKTLRLKDSCSNSDCFRTEPDMAVLLYVTPAMSCKFRGDWSWRYFYGRSLFAAGLCREVVIYWQNYVHSLRRA